MKRVFILAAVLLIASILITVFIVYSTRANDKPFYVGVTFCGDNTQDAKLLIDKVKNYTNLFVLQSGPLMENDTAVIEIGDYAVANGLHFAAFFSTVNHPHQATWIGIAKQQWGNMFAGVYYGDEPGGKMLDDYVTLSQKITKLAGGALTVFENNSSIQYYPDGRIRVIKWDNPSVISDGPIQLNSNITTYYPNGTITLRDDDEFFTMENGTDRISQVEPYEEVLSRHPIPNCAVAAENFVSRNQKILENFRNQWLVNQSFPLFTSDYALYWWDYLSGYDVMLAQLGWNNTVAQEIGLVRGAANLQGKGWGVILTWKYYEWPYLADGDEIYEQMRTAYETGAEYVVLFNYAEDMGGAYGTLKDEHFDALERFWNEVVQNSEVVHGGVKADAVLVLPLNYGCGMRHLDDGMWGLWKPDDRYPQIWSQLQSVLSKHGLELDIVYDDPAYPVAGKYSQIYYWNQTC